MILSGVGRRLGGKWVLRGIELEVPQRLHITGVNGSGKSTLLRIMAGVLHPHEGTATMLRHPCHDVAAKQRISWVSQEPAFYEAMRVEEHFQWHQRVRGQATDLAPVVAAGLDPNALVGTLSRGQKQRLALAQGLSSGAAVLLLDEPFNHLDEDSRNWLTQALQSFAGMVVMASHDPSDWPQRRLEAGAWA